MALVNAHASKESVQDQRVVEMFVPGYVCRLEQSLLFVAMGRERRRETCDSHCKKLSRRTGSRVVQSLSPFITELQTITPQPCLAVDDTTGTSMGRQTGPRGF